MSWKCAFCDELHDELPMDVAYARPQQYFEVPEAERNERVWFNQDTNADLCVIDGASFLIRACLPIPVEEGAEFRQGVWVLVDKPDFLTYVALEGDGSSHPPFEGRLSSEVPGYPSTLMLRADVQLGPSTQRPLIHLKPSAHLLSTEQRQGISMGRVHELVHAAFPEMFG